MDTTSLLSCTGCHLDAMGTIGLFFGLAFIGDEKFGSAYALSGFPLGFVLRGTATRRRPVPSSRVRTPDALCPAGLFFEWAFSLCCSGRRANPRGTRPASGCPTAEGAVNEARGVIAVLGAVVVDVFVVGEPVVDVVVDVVPGLVIDVDIVVLHREGGSRWADSPDQPLLPRVPLRGAPAMAVPDAILRFVAGWSSIVARPPLRGFRGAVDAAASIDSFSSSSSDGMVVGRESGPEHVATLPSAPAFAVATRGGFTRRLLPSRFEETRRVPPSAVFWRFAAVDLSATAGLPAIAPAVLPAPVFRVGLIFGAIVGANFRLNLIWLVSRRFGAK
jgi:hypothetical protein